MLNDADNLLCADRRIHLSTNEYIIENGTSSSEKLTCNRPEILHCAEPLNTMWCGAQRHVCIIQRAWV